MASPGSQGRGAVGWGEANRFGEASSHGGAAYADAAPGFDRRGSVESYSSLDLDVGVYHEGDALFGNDNEIVFEPPDAAAVEAQCAPRRTCIACVPKWRSLCSWSVCACSSAKTCGGTCVDKRGGNGVSRAQRGQPQAFGCSLMSPWWPDLAPPRWPF